MTLPYIYHRQDPELLRRLLRAKQLSGAIVKEAIAVERPSLDVSSRQRSAFESERRS
jgi:hypothetical protein